MKITQLNIEGFRSLKHVTWKPGDLNVIIGPNGSGKSNLLRMLELISASAEGRLSKHILAAGGMGSLVWDGEASDINWTVACLGRPIPSYRLIYRVNLMRTGLSSSYEVREEAVDHYHLDFEQESASSVKHLLQRLGSNAFILDDSDKQNRLRIEESELGETTLSLMSTPLAGNTHLRFVRLDLAAWSVYHDIRVDRDAAIRQPAISRLENRVSPDGQNLINVLHTLYTGDREFKRQVNSAMSAAFGDDFDELIFPPASDQRVQLRVRWKTLKREQSAADLSDGTLRFLFLLAVLASPNPAPLIAIDEPETGLHPSMLPLVAELAVDAAERTQVVFTTHSDQFLDAFRETGVRPTTTVARWENGETTLTTLDDEDLAYWLKDYTLGNLFRSGELESMAS
ncbi:MAG: AAA family ATPase [Armatimonadetes bacterium]|nr:AAA family ATPase [Armatimonadota bacterium]